MKSGESFEKGSLARENKRRGKERCAGRSRVKLGEGKGGRDQEVGVIVSCCNHLIFISHLV